MATINDIKQEHRTYYSFINSITLLMPHHINIYTRFSVTHKHADETVKLQPSPNPLRSIMCDHPPIRRHVTCVLTVSFMNPLVNYFKSVTWICHVYHLHGLYERHTHRHCLYDVDAQHASLFIFIPSEVRHASAMLVCGRVGRRALRTTQPLQAVLLPRLLVLKAWKWEFPACLDWCKSSLAVFRLYERWRNIGTSAIFGTVWDTVTCDYSFCAYPHILSLHNSTLWHTKIHTFPPRRNYGNYGHSDKAPGTHSYAFIYRLPQIF
jgi:hypothetical protein